jgi:light-regulated signal transduction histidine kinase (bacteriophytochrome)
MTATEHKEDDSEQLKRQLEKATAQLEDVRKELESFAYSVSHDLRAPLRAIEGYTQILEEDYAAQLGDEGKRVIGVIVKNSRKMTRLIDDLLAYSRAGRQTVTSEPIDMNKMVPSIAEDQRKKYLEEKPADVRIATLHTAIADGLMIRQIWVHLLGNAFKFSAKRENVIIEIGSKEEPDRIVYFIKDNGAGFEMRYYEKLFNVFQRLHGNDYEGTGIGLALTKRMLTMLGGSPWAEAETDKGATFYFSLPKVS